MYLATRVRPFSVFRAVLFLGVSLFASTSFACTTFQMRGTDYSVIGKSFDWIQDHGMAVINKRNVGKQALSLVNLGAAAKPVQWVSRYGSLTFNQHGREMPIGGINEAGLVVENMWLTSTEFPDDDRPFLNELQMVQYLLDTSANVSEVLTNAAKVRVLPIYATLHYLACDSSGSCATLEYLKERLVTHSGPEMVVNTLTNNEYEESVTYLKNFVGFGGNWPLPTSTSSLDRFVRASSLARAFSMSKGLPVDYAFNVLDSVEQTNGGSPTQWNMVYDQVGKAAYFRTFPAPNKPTTIRKVQLTGWDFSCKKPSQVLDMDDNLSGDVTAHFVDYSRDINRKLAEQALKGLGIKMTKKMIDAYVEYPEMLPCLEK